MIHTKHVSDVLLVSIRVVSRILANFFSHLSSYGRAANRRLSIFILPIHLIDEFIQLFYAVFLSKFAKSFPNLRDCHFIFSHKASQNSFTK